MQPLVAGYLSLAFWAAAYMTMHELLHYAAARLLGYSARFSIDTDGMLPSPSVFIEDEIQGVRRMAVLYAPYIFNMAAIVAPAPLPLRLIALLTLPNAVLEERRSRSSAMLATSITAATALLAATYFAGLYS
ncbi:hypothetical protein CF15_05980 [Pyrodictium occultum]|uniref:Peptidase M50 domain-containing protein n=1 Tax=Pyrodictium occultum TaxID=2309 RepID=A0A0V8RW67_PYROC|nr:hypothetical protein [Pyrodictium occultum]KSW12293.1 hypothetical protein CF15_05980 [Pyrodictium occultum]